MKKNNLIPTAAVALGLAAFIAPAFADTVVNTGASLSNLSPVRDAAILGSSYTDPVPAVGQNITTSIPVSGVTGIPDFTLYSTTTLTGDGSASAPSPNVSTSLQVELTAGNDGSRLGWTNYSVAGVANSGFNLFLVQQADWLTLTSGPVNFDASSSFDTNITDRDASFGANDFAWVVRDSGTFYRTSGFSGIASVTLANPAAVNWYSFDPTVADFGITTMAPVSGGVLGSTFSNIDGVGFLGQYSRDFGASGTFNTQVNSFAVDLAAVPEPSTTAVLVIAGLGFLVWMRRRAPARA